MIGHNGNLRAIKEDRESKSPPNTFVLYLVQQKRTTVFLLSISAKSISFKLMASPSCFFLALFVDLESFLTE